MPMGRKQKETVELRFYEIPQGEPVLALLGEEWNRVYGHDNFYLHFHNLMEIGICRKGEGELIINEHTYTYRTNSVTLIPPNIPHTTISNGMTRNSWEFLYVDVNHVIEELYGDRIAQKMRLLNWYADRHICCMGASVRRLQRSSMPSSGKKKAESVLSSGDHKLSACAGV